MTDMQQLLLMVLFFSMIWEWMVCRDLQHCNFLFIQIKKKDETVICIPEYVFVNHYLFMFLWTFYQEYLSGVKQEEIETSFEQKCKWFWIRVITNLFVLGLIGGSGYLIYYISDTQSVDVSYILFIWLL